MGRVGKGYNFTSVLRERPLLKKMMDTARYLTVISGIRGPEMQEREGENELG